MGNLLGILLAILRILFYGVYCISTKYYYFYTLCVLYIHIPCGIVRHP